jgi:hypothetical protein
MQIDPMKEWQRITQVYRGMYDDELVNLTADADDLTDIARQVLDLELKRRGLGTVLKSRSFAHATRAEGRAQSHTAW